MKQNFLQEIGHLLDEVPAIQWQDHEIRGILYEFTPWHGSSTVTVQTFDDDPRDIGSWKYYFSADSDATRIRTEISEYQQNDEQLVYHRLLIEAAEAMLEIDFSKYIPNIITIDKYHLYKPFQLQVYDMDRTFGFNYCEYALARRLERFNKRSAYQSERSDE